MAIRIETLGGLRAFNGAAELDWLHAQRLRAALITYLAVERTASRATLATLFWPESDEENARHALRQNLFQVKQVLGRDWVDARAHELRVTDAVVTDVAEFEAALARDDCETAARLYRGPFLDGVHVADLKPWESWVDTRRAQLTRDFRRACRKWVESCHAHGDAMGAIVAAQHWIAPDPLDDEGQHALIAALAASGRRTDALRQYETYAKLLEADGLEPLEETKELVEGLGREGEGGRPISALPVAPGGTAPRSTRPARSARWALPSFGVALLATAILAFNRIDRPSLPPSHSVQRVLVMPVKFSDQGRDVPGREQWPLLHRVFIAAIQTTTNFIAVDGAADGAGAADLSTRDALTAAREAGATYVIEPEILAFGETPQVVYSLIDSRTGVRLASGTGGMTETIDAAIGRLSMEAVSALARHSGGDRRVGLYASYSNMTAVMHLIEGQSRLSRDDARGAVEQFDLAVAADSSFGFAYFWLSLGRSAGPNWDYAASLDALDAARPYHARMSRAERQLLDAQRYYLLHRADSALATFEQLAQLHSEVPEAFLGLGESIYHFAGYVGRSRSEARLPLQRVLETSPEFAPMVIAGHVIEIALHERDVEGARHYLPLTFGALEEEKDRWYAAAIVLASDDTAHKSALLDSLASASGRTLSFLVVHTARAGLNLPVADSVAGLLMAPGRVEAEKQLGAGYRLAIGAAKEDWEALLRAWDMVGGRARFDRWMVSAHLAGFDTGGRAERMLDAARTELARGTIPDLGRDPNHELQQMLRALVHDASLSGDSASVALLLERIDRDRASASVTDPLPGMLIESLEARLAMLAGDTARAIRHLEAAVSTVAEPRIANFPLTTMAVQRLQLARLHAAQGDAKQASRWLSSFWQTSSVADLFYHGQAADLLRSTGADIASR